MSVAITVSPVPVVHSADYHVYVTGLTPAHTVAVNNYSNAGGTPFADTAATGTADAKGEFACKFTAQAQVGPYVIVVEDTQGGDVIVAHSAIVVT